MTTLETTRQPQRQYEPYQVSVQEYVTFRRQGFLVVRNLIPLDEVAEINAHMDNLIVGRERLPGIEPPPEEWSEDRKLNHWLRIHMLHRIHILHEYYLLHPRILDVLEALIGPDVLALQTMLFFKQPGQPGQGYHQDSYYIPTFPDTLCGAWLALDHVDEENGCLWMTVGTQNEPVYPDSDGITSNGQHDLKDIEPIYNASHTDEEQNGLTHVARKYPGCEVKVEAEPGDVVFFGGHIIHRSHMNRSTNRTRRAFVSHYCNARSWVPWSHGEPYEGDSAHYRHILARGMTHLPYAQPRFGTPCAANQSQQPKTREQRQTAMMPGANGMMVKTPHVERDHND